MPTIAIDYGYLIKREELPPGTSPSPILVTKDSHLKRTTSDVLPSKGIGNQYSIDTLVSILVDSDHSKLILKSDDEPSIVALRSAAL